jgi:hypothetical protein
VVVIAVCGRKDAEVAGRARMRGFKTGAARDVGARRPVAVAGRAGGVICGCFLVGPVIWVGATRTTCSRLEEKRTAGCFRGFGTVSRGRDACVPGVTLGETSSAPRSLAKGLGSSMDVKVW